ncbi:NAD-dependent epimerase/dehydratase family protein [Streptomyces sp. R41]|uniref:NAD-dependent epimerase/dehydratase family protein n=1 Tax=Streptomyces sp. R41 TaxID=3238632 RepID=A0AB39RVZ4_9ACTN
MRYLVTGATGFVGQCLLRHLVRLGHEVTALVRDGRSVPGGFPGLRTVEGDLATGAGLAAAAEGADRVVHLAAVTKARTHLGYAEVNTRGTGRLCAVLAAFPEPPRLVLCSSLAAAGPGRQRREEDPPSPVSAYGRSKLGGELALRAHADRLPGVVVRPPIVYGPGDREFVPRLVKAVRAGMLPAVGRRGPRRYSLIHVDDLCRALLTAAESGEAGAVYHVSDGIEHRWERIGAVTAAVLGCRPPRVIHIPAPLAVVAGHAGRLTGASLLNPDKVAELRHPAWTCAVGRLPFVPAVTLPAGLTTALAAYR